MAGLRGRQEGRRAEGVLEQHADLDDRGGPVERGDLHRFSGTGDCDSPAASADQAGIVQKGANIVRTILRTCAVGALIWVGTCAPARAQLKAAGTVPIVYGHHHINTPDIPAQLRFWIEGMGGVSFKLGTSPAERIKFTDVIVQLTPG